MKYNYKDGNDGNKVEYIFDFSVRNKKTTTDIIWNMYNLYNKQITQLIRENLLDTRPQKQAEIIDFQSIQDKKQSKCTGNLTKKTTHPAVVIPFPKQEKEQLSQYSYIFDSIDKIFSLIRDFKKAAVLEIAKRKYTEKDQAFLVELLKSREQVLKHTFLESNKEEDTHKDIDIDFMELKESISMERSSFDASMIDYFYFKYIGVVNLNPFLKDKRKLTDKLETCFVTLYTELIKFKILAHIKKQDQTQRKITIQEFTPVLKEIDELNNTIDKHLKNKSNSFYRQFQGVNFLLKRLYFS